MKIRFPTGEIIHYHRGLDEVKYQIWITKRIPKENQIFLVNGEIINPENYVGGEESLLDLAVVIYNNKVFCHPSLNNAMLNSKYHPINDTPSSLTRNINDLQYTPRFYDIKDIYFENEEQRKRNHQFAQPYYDQYEKYKEERLDHLSAICSKTSSFISTITTFNKPYIPLFRNFLASCDFHNIPIRDNLIVFPMDEEAHQAALEHKVHSYFKKGTYGPTTSQHQQYGDLDFIICMFMKNAIVQDMLTLGQDVLFQDIDMVWLQDPLPDLIERAERFSLDFQFMFDGWNPRFQPLYYNSGFFFIQNNPYARRAWQVVFDNYDKIWHYHSQQTVVNILMSAFKERGLRTFLLPPEEYINGHLINPEGKNSISIDAHSKVVHVSWTGNIDFKFKKLKENKLWYLE